MHYVSNSTQSPVWTEPTSTFPKEKENKNLRKAAIVVEPRRLPRLVHVIRNHKKHLGPEWDFYICCNQETYDDYYKKIIPDLKHIPGIIENDNLTHMQYNFLMVSGYFWEVIDFICDKCLIFQYDTWMFHGDIDQFMEYDYLGAPWWNRYDGGNGGFSLRSPKVMREVIRRFDYSGNAQHRAAYHKNIASLVPGYTFLEDFHYFSDLIPFVGKMAPREINRKFAFEHVIEDAGITPVAIHKTHLTNVEVNGVFISDLLRRERNTSEFEFKYNDIFNNQGDIEEHLPILREYASRCDHVTEFGVRYFVSTYAFAAGNPKKLISYDIESSEENHQEFKKLLDESGLQVNFEYVIKDVLQAEIEETDFLFIDTEHNYLQLKNELRLHAKKVRKYIGFHDTVTFGYKDSNYYRNNGSTEKYEDGTEKQGLMPAIEEFLQENPEWQIDLRLENCNGLMILKKNS